MLKFIKHSMLGMDDAAFYPMLALLLFGSFFLGWLIYTLMMPKSDAEDFANIPLDRTESKTDHHE
jgi:hypothetical protein